MSGEVILYGMNWYKRQHYVMCNVKSVHVRESMLNV